MNLGVVMEEFNLDALDVESAERAVQQHLDEEASQVMEISDEDDCAGGACKI